MKSATFRILLFAVALAAAFSAVPALAFDGPVPNNCFAFGHQLQGMTETEALAAISASATVPVFDPLTVTVDGKPFYFRPNVAMAVDAAKMLAVAYEPTSAVGFDIAPAYAMQPTPITTWVQRLGKATYQPAVNARYYVRYGRIRVYRGLVGHRLALNPVVLEMRSQVASVAASGEVTTAPVAFSRISFRPRITVGTLPPVILVDLSDRRIRLYNRGTIWRSYPCAVGTSSYPTPRGTWKVVRKVMWPTWSNPGSAWAADMPSYIGPGPSNPLGTRALYLDAPGIRIHGTTKRGSIGTAASHGCMRMLREDIEALYPLVPVGTTVYIVK